MKQRFILLDILLCFIAFSASAQVTDLEKAIRDEKSIEKNLASSTSDSLPKWRFGGMFSLNASQASFTNWASGGENSVGANAFANLYINYVGKKSLWENAIELGYGLLYQETDGLTKTDDKIQISTKYGRKASKYWYYAAMADFKTQFSEGYEADNDSDYISNFMAPAYLIGAIGMDYKPFKFLTAFISPVTAKFTFVLDDKLSNLGSYGVDKGHHSRTECGGYIRILYDQSFLKKSITITSKLDLFSNYTDKPQNIDVNWENIITFKINKYISASINTMLIYDDDIKYLTGKKDAEGNDITKGPKVQFKEVVGLGLSYKF